MPEKTFSNRSRRRMGMIWLILLLIRTKKTKLEKLVAHIAFIKLCKKEQLIAAFAKVIVSTRNGICKLKWRIARLVMETELQNEDRQKRNLWKDIRSINVFLSTSLSVIVYNALLHQANIAVKSRIKVIKKTSQLVIQTRNNQLQWWT